MKIIKDRSYVLVFIVHAGGKVIGAANRFTFREGELWVLQDGFGGARLVNGVSVDWLLFLFFTISLSSALGKVGSIRQPKMVIWTAESLDGYT